MSGGDECATLAFLWVNVMVIKHLCLILPIWSGPFWQPGRESRSRNSWIPAFAGMSGVGKTYLSGLLRNSQRFHYSGDYRIGTRYLDEPIMDMIKQQAMQVPFLKELL